MKTFTATVVSTKMNKTVIVEREIVTTHPLYKKKLRRSRRLKAHSDLTLAAGDKVMLVSSRPISKEKHYKVVEKMTQGAK